MIRTKKAALGVLVGFVAVWPAVQLALSSSLEIDPWKFFGWGTYATTIPEQRVLLIEMRGEREVHIHNTWLSEASRDLYRSYRRERALLGRLAPPHELAKAILAERPEIAELKIVVLRDEVSAETSRTVARPGTAFMYRQ